MTKSSGRVAAGVAAHTYSQAVTVITQLASLPIFLSRWSAELYGHWIVITAIPTYLSLSDVGLLSAAGNLMSMQHAKGRLLDVQNIFKSSVFAVSLIIPAVAALSVWLVLAFDFGLAGDEKYALCVLIITALLTASCGLFDAAYRPFGLYPRVSFLLATTRAVEWIGTLIGLFLSRGLLGPALGLLAGRSVSCVGLFVLSRFDVPQLSWSPLDADKALAKRLVSHGVGFLAFTVGTLVTLQGMIILVGTTLGATAAAVFNSFRTLSRMLAQVSILTSKSLSPEISALYGAGQNQQAEALLRRTARITLGFSCAAGVILILVGRPLIRWWTHGKIPFDPLTFGLLILTAIATGYWQIASVRLTATNSHKFLALAFSVTSLFTILAAKFGIRVFGLPGASAAALFGELLMIGFTAWALHRGRKGPLAI
jgi:O-antigen/teichoic acid export membrane protein